MAALICSATVLMSVTSVASNLSSARLASVSKPLSAPRSRSGTREDGLNSQRFEQQVRSAAGIIDGFHG